MLQMCLLQILHLLLQPRLSQLQFCRLPQRRRKSRRGSWMCWIRPWQSSIWRQSIMVMKMTLRMYFQWVPIFRWHGWKTAGTQRGNVFLRGRNSRYQGRTGNWDVLSKKRDIVSSKWPSKTISADDDDTNGWNSLLPSVPSHGTIWRKCNIRRSNSIPCWWEWSIILILKVLLILF